MIYYDVIITIDINTLELDMKILTILLFFVGMFSLHEASHANVTDTKLPYYITVMIKLADNGSPAAQLIVGSLYQNGNVVERDIQKSVKYITMSATQGLAMAQNHLGVLYLDGYVDDAGKNYEKAKYWFEMAAEQDYRTAYHNLGHLYSEDMNPFKNDETANVYWRVAAGLGDAESQYHLAVSYVLGDGIEKNVKIAYEWFKKANINGYADAKFAMENLAREHPHVQND